MLSRAAFCLVIFLPAVAAAQDECVVGRWIADNAALAHAIATADPTSGNPQVTGSAVFDYAADGGLRVEMTDFAIVLSVEGTGSTVTIAADGTDEGRWTSESGRLRLWPTSKGAALTVAVASGDGGDPDTVDMKGWLETNLAAYRCGETLDVDLPLGGSPRAVTWHFTKVEH